MNKVLILGAGMVAKPIIQYLLQKEFIVTVASLNVEDAEKMVNRAVNGTAVYWTTDDLEKLKLLISENDVVVSLLPYIHHVMVAKLCIQFKKNMVTTSYVKPEMKALDQEARQAGIIILNEIGLDPGIDHMSAMRIIDNVHGRNGKIAEFYSLCGALPAPEFADNPFRYKFSWSPKGVVLAGNNDASFLRNSEMIDVPTKDLFKNPMSLEFPDVGELHVYPNRDSLSYIEIYGIPETKTMYRGTFRYRGWCEILDVLKALKCTLTDKHDFTGKTYAEALAMVNGVDTTIDLPATLAARLDISEKSLPIEAMTWLGLFSNVPMNRNEDSMYEITSDLMIEKMMLSEDDRDMIAMMHIFKAVYPDGTSEIIKSRMLAFGSKKTDTAIALTVALPAAIAVEMLLNNKIQIKGVHIPVVKEIYDPVLDKLAELNIKMIEEYGLPDSENIK